MKRCVGALLSCASSTSLITRAMVLSAAAAVTFTRRTVSLLMVPAKPRRRRTWSWARAPGNPRLIDCRCAIGDNAVGGDAITGQGPGTWRRSRVARLVLRETRRFFNQRHFGNEIGQIAILARALAVATPSSKSPREQGDDDAASSAAPMNIAPMAAILIRVSIVNGVPVTAAAMARQAIGTSPTSMAVRKNQSLHLRQHAQPD